MHLRHALHHALHLLRRVRAHHAPGLPAGARHATTHHAPAHHAESLFIMSAICPIISPICFVCSGGMGPAWTRSAMGGIMRPSVASCPPSASWCYCQAPCRPACPSDARGPTPLPTPGVIKVLQVLQPCHPSHVHCCFLS